MTHSSKSSKPNVYKNDIALRVQKPTSTKMTKWTNYALCVGVPLRVRLFGATQCVQLPCAIARNEFLLPFARRSESKACASQQKEAALWCGSVVEHKSPSLLDELFAYDYAADALQENKSKTQSNRLSPSALCKRAHL